MITYQIEAGTTDVSVVMRAVDADGLPVSFDHATSGIDLKYRRETAANVDITEASLAALTTAHTDGGVEPIGNGYFRLDLPDAAVAAGVAGVMVHGTATDVIIIGCYVQLTVTAEIQDIVDGILDEAIAGHNTAGTVGKTIIDIPTDADLATALAAADDAVLTAIGDLPTNAELATALGTADDAVLTAIGDLPTNAELATALGTADDAVLSAIATVQSDTNDIQTRLPAALTGDGLMKVDIIRIDGDADTEWKA